MLKGNVPCLTAILEFRIVIPVVLLCHTYNIHEILTHKVAPKSIQTLVPNLLIQCMNVITKYQRKYHFKEKAFDEYNYFKVIKYKTQNKKIKKQTNTIGYLVVVITYP